MWVVLAYNFNVVILVLIIEESCIGAFLLILFITVLSLLLPCIIILFLHLLSTKHKCTQPCYFTLLLKPTAQKERMDWNYSTTSSRLRVALVVVLVVLCSLPLFRSTEGHHSL
jgi:anaerobic C4-dicarboxylate transporter